MKLSAISQCVGSFCLGFFGMTAVAEPNEVPAPIEHIYVPHGFDNNDNIEVVLKGTFPDTCYQVGRAGYKVDVDTMQVRVWSTAFDYSKEGVICSEVLTPFIQKVSIGLLPKGDFKVVLDSPSRSVEGKFKVAEATTSMPDENLYAPAHSGYVSTTRSGKQAITLVGNFPMLYKGCMIMKDVKIYRNPLDILVVLPIVQIIDDARCPINKNTEFKIQKTVDVPIHGEGLLHVRVANGSSINHFFNTH